MKRNALRESWWFKIEEREIDSSCWGVMERWTEEKEKGLLQHVVRRVLGSIMKENRERLRGVGLLLGLREAKRMAVHMDSIK